MSTRYERNIGAITREENEQLKTFNVCVIGCGGLGGHVIENLARLGIGHITAVDGDVFQESNLNRQILSAEDNLGEAKARAARERVGRINSRIELRAVCDFLTEANSFELIQGHDAVVDALDNIPGRILLEEACEKAAIPLIHGAIAGWYGQVAVVMPGDRLLSALYAGGQEKGAELETGNPSFTPAVIAALQAAETLKVLLHRPQILRKKLLTTDLLNQRYEVIEL